MLRKFLMGLAMLTGVGQAFAQTPLKFRNGYFKMVQLTDLHYKLGVKASQQALDCIREMVTEEKPDLVMVTGDIIYSMPADSTLSVVLSTLSSLGVPFAITFGNHDYDFKAPSAALYAQMQKTPHCVMPVQQGKNLDYSLPVMSSNGKRTAAVLYCIDTHNRSSIAGVDGYQWITQSQITWYRQRSSVYKQQNGGKALPALAFMHIPLPEYNYATDNTQCPMYGSRLERAYAPSLNSEFEWHFIDASIVIDRYIGSDEDVLIPEEIDGYSVMEIKWKELLNGKMVLTI